MFIFSSYFRAPNISPPLPIIVVASDRGEIKDLKGTRPRKKDPSNWIDPLILVILDAQVDNMGR